MHYTGGQCKSMHISVFAPCSSSGIALISMRNVQADSCLTPEQIDTLFISVEGLERVFWGGGHFGPEAQKMHMTVRILFCSLLFRRGKRHGADCDIAANQNIRLHESERGNDQTRTVWFQAINESAHDYTSSGQAGNIVDVNIMRGHIFEIYFGRVRVSQNKEFDR